MPTYRLFFFRHGQLDHWEQFEADDHMAAIEACGKWPSDGPVELWSEGGRVATLKPVGTQRAHKLERGPRGESKRRS